MSKTPEYTKKAVAEYQKKFDRIMINLPKGTKEEIKQRGKSVNGLVNELIKQWLENN